MTARRGLTMKERESHRSGIVEVKLKGILQLFNSMDPSPFPERDLDADAEEFIVGWAMEYSRHAPLRLIVHLSSALEPSETEDSIRAAINHYFAYRADVIGREFRLLMRQGRLSLLIGILFLGTCLAVARLIGTHWDSTAASLLRESLAIGGWVAMWKPLEIYLYGWWPLLRRRRVYERLSRMPVEIRQASDIGRS
jgi:hypothetical protein